MASNYYSEAEDLKSKLKLDFNQIKKCGDLEKEPSLNPKVTTTFFNHFIITMVKFINDMMNSCEEKLYHFDEKLKRLEASIYLLEVKLDSIPETADVIIESAVSEKSFDIQTMDKELKENNQNTIRSSSNSTHESTSTLEKYKKIINYEISTEVVKLKMEQDGFNPHLLNENSGTMKIEIPTSNVQQAETSGVNCANNSNQEVGGGEETPGLNKYRKMVHYGVPLDAVKLKMKQDGLEPNLL